MKSIFNKNHFCPFFIIMITLLFLNSLNSFSQDKPSYDNNVADSVAINLVNDFIMAVNSGEREPMKDFIVHHYDQNALKRIPLFAVVSLNLSFYYETAGMGYKFVKMIPTKENLISAELYNFLTEKTIKFDFPVSGAPLFKINRFIKTVPAKLEFSENIDKHFSNQEIISRIEKCLDKLEEDEEFSGTVLVAKNGEVLFKTAIGDASKAYEIPNSTTTKFNMASVGKMFTGLAITQLVEQGKLSFDDPISKYVSQDWLSKEVSEKIQIKHLLTHTSGLGDYFRDAYQQCDIPFFRNLEDYKSLTSDDTLMFEPGSRFSYSNTGMLLLGVVIENITNIEYFKYLKNNIFEPIEMTNTDGFDKDSPVINRATGYTKVYENGNVTWNNHQFTRVMRGSPSGGVYSTIEDMLKFDIAIRSNKLLSPEYTEILLEGRPELNASFHSYGFFVSEGAEGRAASHKGDGRGMNCQFKMFLDTGYTIIVLSNYSQPSANMVANVIEQLIVK